MKINMLRQLDRARKPALAALLAGYIAIGGISVGAATSFPNYPLQTGAGAVSPNIMFILDDSNSMQFRTMPYDMDSDMTRDLLDTPFERSVNNNTIFYSPAKTYTPWLNADATTMTGGDTATAVYTDQLSVGGATGSVVDSVQSVFYVPKAGATDLANVTQYDRYRIATVSGTPTIVKDIASPTVLADTVVSSGWWQKVTVTGSMTKLAVYTSGGSGNVGIWVGDAAWSRLAFKDVNYSSSENDNTEVVILSNISPGDYNVYLSGNAAGARVQILGWTPNEVAALPTTTRDNAAELTNFSTWYSYYSTRMKIAKGGATKAFAPLASTYRIGFDRLNSGSILMPIPTSSTAEFSGSNKTNWFSNLLSTPVNGGTPMRSALKRSGEYYRTAAAWTDSGATTMSSCRTAYAMLSTDGYWNLDNGFTVGADTTAADGTPLSGTDSNKDGYLNTLADVAAYYYKLDLMPTLANNVPTTQFDKANWQHMVTFGISLGNTQAADATPPSTWPDPTGSDTSPGIYASRMLDLWHAAIDGHGRYIGAADSDQYAQALQDTLTQIDNGKASGSNITANGNSLNDGAQLFQAMYNTPIWTGDILAYDITTGGIAGKAQYDWSLAQKASTDSAFKTRPVYMTTSSGVKQVTVSTASTVMPSAYQGGTTANSTGVSLADNVAYLLGDASKEKRNGGKLRNRTEILPDPATGNNMVVGDPIGDIVNSSPFYVRQLNTLFIGANDGMLHGVDSTTGKVLFSYMPFGIDYNGLAGLSDPKYAHQFFVDGQVDVANQDQGGGINILAASLGRGGRGIFALDVTSVNTHDATGVYTGTFGTSNVLFDKTGSLADSDMGYVLSQPQVRMSMAGYPVIISGNGVDSSSGKAVLYVYKTDGTLLKKIVMPQPTAGTNGLMQTSVADTNGDGVIDKIYAGDLMGNVWKIDASNIDPTQWSVAITVGNGGSAVQAPLFTAKDAAGTPQPITGGITATKDATGSGNIFLVFGTGRLISTSDLVTTAVQPTQTIYGLIDGTSQISGRAALTTRTFAYGTDSSGNPARSLEDYQALPSGSKGWYVDLATDSNTYARGERVVTSPVVNGTAAWVSSLIPQLGSGCTNTGHGYLNALDAFTGTNPPTLSYFYFGSGSTGKITVTTPGPSGTTNSGYKSSVDLGIAMPSAPAIVDSKVVVNGSNANMASADIASGVPDSYRMMWRELVNQN